MEAAERLAVPPPSRAAADTRRDLLWNLASLGPLAVAGLTLNLVIARFYGAETIGVFNQVLAVYALLSQVAVGGFCFSVLAFSSANAGARAECRSIVFAAIILTVMLASSVAMVVWLAAPFLGRLFGSDDVGHGIRLISPGLVFFALNKVLLFAVNGLGYLRAFALGQGGRFMLVLAAFACLVASGAEGAQLPAAFSIAEGMLLLALAVYWGRVVGWRARADLRQWFRRHGEFGRRAFWNGLLLEVSSKVDIVILGLLMSDGAVGLYAFAANIAEGLAQIPVVIQAVLAPRLADIAKRRDQAALSLLVSKAVWRAIGGMAVACLIVTSLYIPIADILTGDPAFGEAWPVLACLAGGIALSAGHLPFAVLLNQAGKPEVYNWFLRQTVTLNIAGNLLLIPLLGLVGAAAATALSMLASAWLLRRLVHKSLELRL